MSEEEWNLEHGLRADGSKRRRPAKKPKPKFYEIDEGLVGSEMCIRDSIYNGEK